MSAPGAQPPESPDRSHYIIRGGIEGRERLRILSRVMQSATHDVLIRAGIGPGMSCLEVACGGGDVAFDLARMVNHATDPGHVVATDIDPTKLDLARAEAAELGLANLEFRLADIMQDQIGRQFDLVHARFLLTHLSDPLGALERMGDALRPGGVIVIEDIDFDGHFCHPDCPALWRYVELYSEAVRRRGGDANIGRRLPALLAEAGFQEIGMCVSQPAGVSGEVKLLSAITMDNIADTVLTEGLATRQELDQVVDQLFEFAHATDTLISIPRIVQTWARRG